ncbi:MAG TPA: tetratricopeptide repeat protein [Candidatus Omnitrophota bacterium]|nr:tetratricopeptide repeat protein [Candidatus Omnitrophota bacterium]HPT07219.1 tetratricopeptide repeat protein [Candidatus Omnitrophota bacterium]
MSNTLTKVGGVVIACVVFCAFALNNACASDTKTSQALSHYILGLMHDRLGQYDLAVPEFTAALKADYDISVIHVSLAVAYIKNNELAKAVNELNCAAGLDPQAVEPHAILALLYSAQNKNTAANQEYEIALRNATLLEPKNVDMYKSLAAVYMQQKKLPEAENTYRLIIELAPNDAEARFYLGSVLDLQKKRPLAEVEFKKAIELKADYAEALNYLGYMYIEDNRNLDSAERLINKALALQPDNGAYLDSLGWFYFKKGLIAEATKYLKRASTLIDDPVVFNHLGEAYFKSGDFVKAKDSWKRSLQLDPSQDALISRLKTLE